MNETIDISAWGETSRSDALAEHKYCYDRQEKLIMDIKTLLESVNMFAEDIKNRLGLEQFSIFARGDDIFLNSIIVGKNNQGRGIGSKAIQMLVDYADSKGKRIILTPAVQDKNHGTTSRSRLVKFYKKFGFVESKGRNIDYEIGAGKMYRNPVKKP